MITFHELCVEIQEVLAAGGPVKNDTIDVAYEIMDLLERHGIIPDNDGRGDDPVPVLMGPLDGRSIVVLRNIDEPQLHSFASMLVDQFAAVLENEGHVGSIAGKVPLIVALGADQDIGVLDENEMREAGWVRAEPAVVRIDDRLVVDCVPCGAQFAVRHDAAKAGTAADEMHRLGHGALGHQIARLAEASECTGLTATWCPVHGDCTCPEGEYDEMGGCPLHGSMSNHAEGEE